MKTATKIVGVRELRTHLSAYLRTVAHGGSVTIGDRRRRPVARIVPVEQPAELEHLAKLERAGLVQRGTGGPGGFRPVKPRRGARLVSDIVIEDRR